MRRVAVIGPGRVGGALALGLDHAGNRVVAVCGRPGSASLERFTELVPQARPRPLETVGRDADLVVVAVPDDALAGVLGAAAAAGGVSPGSRWIHTSGGHGLDVLGPVGAAGAAVAALHPAMTFPDPVSGAERLPGVSWAVTAAPADLGWARVLVTDLRGSPVTLPESSRTLYHAGLTVGANATTTVVTLARDLLLGAGVSDPQAFLGPLVEAAAGNAAAGGVRALTGPVRRGDAGTVAAHLHALRDALPEAVGAYLALAELMLAQARRAGLDPQRVAAVRAVLERFGGAG